ncbi:hypothetical protein HDU76_000309 [Blyttiomyces sp. JEL0837]|nr:hypothetical protein HDU76_000309 [Blyttiomyces sp. JEL0837]
MDSINGAFPNVHVAIDPQNQLPYIHVDYHTTMAVKALRASTIKSTKFLNPSSGSSGTPAPFSPHKIITTTSKFMTRSAHGDGVRDGSVLPKPHKSGNQQYPKTVNETDSEAKSQTPFIQVDYQQTKIRSGKIKHSSTASNPSSTRSSSTTTTTIQSPNPNPPRRTRYGINLKKAQHQLIQGTHAIFVETLLSQIETEIKSGAFKGFTNEEIYNCSLKVEDGPACLKAWVTEDLLGRFTVLHREFAGNTTANLFFQILVDYCAKEDGEEEKIICASDVVGRKMKKVKRSGAKDDVKAEEEGVATEDARKKAVLKCQPMEHANSSSKTHKHHCKKDKLKQHPPPLPEPPAASPARHQQQQNQFNPILQQQPYSHNIPSPPTPLSLLPATILIDLNTNRNLYINHNNIIFPSPPTSFTSPLFSNASAGVYNHTNTTGLNPFAHGNLIASNEIDQLLMTSPSALEFYQLTQQMHQTQQQQQPVSMGVGDGFGYQGVDFSGLQDSIKIGGGDYMAWLS